MSAKSLGPNANIPSPQNQYLNDSQSLVPVSNHTPLNEAHAADAGQPKAQQHAPESMRASSSQGMSAIEPAAAPASAQQQRDVQQVLQTLHDQMSKPFVPARIQQFIDHNYRICHRQEMALDASEDQLRQLLTAKLEEVLHDILKEFPPVTRDLVQTFKADLVQLYTTQHFHLQNVDHLAVNKSCKLEHWKRIDIDQDENILPLFKYLQASPAGLFFYAYHTSGSAYRGLKQRSQEVLQQPITWQQNHTDQVRFARLFLDFIAKVGTDEEWLKPADHQKTISSSVRNPVTGEWEDYRYPKRHYGAIDAIRTEWMIGLPVKRDVHFMQTVSNAAHGQAEQITTEAFESLKKNISLELQGKTDQTDVNRAKIKDILQQQAKGLDDEIQFAKRFFHVPKLLEDNYDTGMSAKIAAHRKELPEYRAMDDREAMTRLRGRYGDDSLLLSQHRNPASLYTKSHRYINTKVTDSEVRKDYNIYHFESQAAESEYYKNVKLDPENYHNKVAEVLFYRNGQEYTLRVECEPEVIKSLGFASSFRNGYSDLDRLIADRNNIFLDKPFELPEPKPQKASVEDAKETPKLESASQRYRKKVEAAKQPLRKAREIGYKALDALLSDHEDDFDEDKVPSSSTKTKRKPLALTAPDSLGKAEKPQPSPRVFHTFEQILRSSNPKALNQESPDDPPQSPKLKRKPGRILRKERGQGNETVTNNTSVPEPKTIFNFGNTSEISFDRFSNTRFIGETKRLTKAAMMQFNSNSRKIYNKVSEEFKKLMSKLWSEIEKVKQHAIEKKVLLTEESMECSSENIIRTAAFSDGVKHAPIPLHANQLLLNAEGSNVHTLAQSPQDANEIWSHWHAIFTQGADVVELKSLKYEPSFIQSKLGINIFNEFLKNDENNRIMIGEFEINAVELEESKSNHLKSLNENIFKINVLNTQTQQQQTIHYKIIEADYGHKRFDAKTLEDLVSNQRDGSLWVTSNLGQARPSAYVTALQIAQEIKQGKIKDTEQLILRTSAISMAGRKIRGSKFIHSQEQFTEIVLFGINMLEAKKSEQKSESQKSTKDTEEVQEQVFKFSKLPQFRFKNEQTAMQVQSFQQLLGLVSV